MTEDKKLKRRVRDRMSKTGESYTTARSQVVQKRERNRAARTRLSAASAEPTSNAAIEQATGRTWDQWFTILDASGAQKMKHPQIARLLKEERGVDGWWAQSITVGYERARGMRLKYEHADGFAVSASKTVAVPLDVLFQAVVGEEQRKRWLTDGEMSLRTSQTGRSARFDWEDGATRVNVGFIQKGPSKSMVALSHERLSDADDAETMKALWRQRLARLKSFVES